MDPVILAELSGAWTHLGGHRNTKERVTLRDISKVKFMQCGDGLKRP